jgi:hypothetical protein
MNMEKADILRVTFNVINIMCQCHVPRRQLLRGQRDTCAGRDDVWGHSQHNMELLAEE